MKTPISYYGGKQIMLKHILPIIPKHSIYCEPFFGGGAVFWAKEKVDAEIVNDYNGLVVNFYEQLKSNYQELKDKVDATPFSRDAYKKALVIYENPYLFKPVEKAWSFWVCTIQGFSNQIGSWRSSQPRVKESLLNYNKKQLLSVEHSKRLELVQIENVDASYLIARMDHEEAFFYVDPPYVGSDQGHYGGYTQEHFNKLLDTLSKVKGKFLLSSYRNEQLQTFKEKYNWSQKELELNLSVSNKAGKKKFEVLTANYQI